MTKVLVIEDEAPLLQETLNVLRFEGFEVIGAENGRVGVQLARKHRPDLIICDIRMPELDGYGVLRELRGDSSTATTPFIFLTAKTERADMRKGMELGADDYITKPFMVSELLAAVRTRLERKIAEENQRLQALSHRRVEVQEAERRHIARELHDEVGQILTGLKMILGLSKRIPADAMKIKLDEAQALVNELTARVGELSLDLRPTTLDDLGLLFALLQHFERYRTRTQVRVDFRHTGLERRFPAGMETAAYRIIQEALTNVARHTSVGKVSVRLWADQDALNLRIEDQGNGLDLETTLSAGPAAGLIGMRERATLLGGQLIVESAPGGGTRVFASLPLGDVDEEESAPVGAGATLDTKWSTQTETASFPGDSAFETPRDTGKRPASRRVPPTISTVLAGSHGLIRQGLRGLLEAEPGFSVVGEAAHGLEAIDLVERRRPDVLILDLVMSGLSGLNVARQVTRRAPKTRILVLSMHATQAYVLEAMQSGATGYALKEASTDDLVQAVRDVAAGRRYLSPALSERATDFYLSIQQTEDAALDVYGTLTSREREILHLVLEGYKNAEIADRLSISPRTVETHRANMMRKLGLRTQADLVRYALRRGIIPLEE